MTTVWDDPALARAPEPPRDRWGRYLITPAAGGKAIGHIRATTWAKTVAEEGALSTWKQRQTAIGIASRPALLAAIAATDPTDKRTLDGICEKALEASGANDRREIGTAVHAYTEGHDLGIEQVVPDPWSRDVDAYAAAMTAAGVTIVPGMVERICVLPSITVAGTFDRLVTIGGDTQVMDLKTGSSVNYHTDWAIQLALYAHAETLWTPATDTHEAMPPVSRTHALIVHLPAGEATCDIYELDIARGWEMVEVCGTVRQWRKAKGLLVKVEHVAIPATPTIVDLGAAGLLAPPAPPAPRPVGGHEAAVHEERITHLRTRLVTLIDHDDRALDEVLRRVPGGLVTFRQHGDGVAVCEPWMADEWDAIITAVEATFGVPFTADVDPAARLLRDDPRISALKERVVALPADLVEGVQDEAVGLGVPKLSSGEATVTDLDTVERIVRAAEVVAVERRGMAAAHLSALPADVTTESVLVPLGIDPTAPRFTDGQLARIGDICDACSPESGPLLVSDGRGALVVADDALDRLLDRFGGKSPLLAEARRICDALDLDKPKASTDVVASIPLVARLAVTDVAA